MTIRIYILFLLLFTITANAKCQYRVSYLHMGRIEMQNQNYRNALKFFNAELKNYPNNYKAFYFRGFTKYLLDDLVGAENDLSKAIEIFPYQAEYYLLRSQIYSDQVNYKKALADLDTAISIDSSFHKLYYYRSLIYLDLRMYENALADCEKLIKSGAKFENLMLIYGSILSNLGKQDEAIEIFQNIIADDSSKVNAFLQLGLVYLQKKEYNLAWINFNHIVETDSLNTLAIYYRGIANMKLNYLDQAKADLDTVLSVHPNNQQAYFNRAILQSQTQNKYNAVDDYLKILHKNPDNLLVLFNMGVSMFQMGEFENAIISFTKVIELYPDYADAYKNRGIAKYRLGDEKGYLEDIDTYKEIVEKNKDKSDTTKYNEGLMLLEMTHLSADFTPKEIMQSRPQYRQIDIQMMPLFRIALTINPSQKQYAYLCTSHCNKNEITLICENSDSSNSVKKTDTFIDTTSTDYEVHLRTVKELMESNDFETANQYLQSLKSIYPSDPLLSFLNANLIINYLEKIQAQSSNYTMEYGKWLSGNFNKAINLYNEVLTILPDFYFAHYNLGYAYYLIEDFELAIDEFNKALEIKNNGPTFYNKGLLSLITGRSQEACTALSHAGQLGITDAYSVIKNYCNK